MAICAQCKHFRRVKPPSQLLAVAIGTTDAAISNALTKMGEDEQKQKEEEAAYKKQQALTDRIDAAWATRPVMSEYCGLREADGDYLIAEVKNRDHKCADFEAGRPELRRCSDCLFRIGAAGNAIDAKWEKSFGDSSLMNTAVGTSTSTSDNLLNKYRDGVGPRKAFDITGAYQSKGIMTIKPVYLDYCGKLSNEDGNEFVVCILQNSHQTCQYWQRKGANEAEVVADNDQQPQAAVTMSPGSDMVPAESERDSSISQASVGDPEPKASAMPGSGEPRLTAPEMVAENLQRPLQEPDPSTVELVPGNPPLTQELVNLLAAFWEWALDIKLDAQGRAILQQDCVKDWKGKNKQEAIESVAFAIKTFELLNQSSESDRLTLHENVWASLIIGMQNVKSNFNDWLVKAYYTANPPLAPGHPPLTRKISDATVEAFNFLAKVDHCPLDRNPRGTTKSARDHWAKQLASTYVKLSPDQQQFYAQMPALWAVLCEQWKHASPGEREWLKEQWRQQLPWWTSEWSWNFETRQMMQWEVKAEFSLSDQDDEQAPSPLIPSLESRPPSMPGMDASTGRVSGDPFSEAIRKINEEAAQDEGKVPETPEEAMELQNRAEKRRARLQNIANMMKIKDETAKSVIQNLRV